MSRTGRPDRKRQLVDAAERLLIEEGPAGVTTRRVAAAAGMNQALVHYHFDRTSDLLLAVHDRMSEVVQARLTEIYRSDLPFIEKWRRQVTSFFNDDLPRGYPKIWLELTTLAVNQPELRSRVVPRLDVLRSLFVEALEREIDERGLDRSSVCVEAVAALAATLTEGMFVEKLLGFGRGHAELVATMENFLRITLDGARPLKVLEDAVASRS